MAQAFVERARLNSHAGWDVVEEGGSFALNCTGNEFLPKHKYQLCGPNLSGRYHRLNATVPIFGYVSESTFRERLCLHM
jgi:hypothetical protein